MSEIVYLEDIVKELSEEFDIPEEEVLAMCKKSLTYATELIKNPEIISISFPNLGVLHFNYKRAKGHKLDRGIYKYTAETIKGQLALVNEIAKEHPRLVHKRTGFIARFKKFFWPNRKERLTIGKRKLFDKLELKQNKIKK